MQIITTNQVGDVLELWARARGISVKQLAGEILAEACKYFLDGKSASLRESV